MSETFGRGQGTGPASVPNYTDWREMSRSFRDMAGYFPSNYNLSTEDLPIRVSGTMVTGELFSIVGVEPLMGRYILPDDTEEGRDRVVVLGYQLAQKTFLREDVLGRSLVVNGEEVTVVGVMPRGFEFPPRSGSQLWTPLTFADPNSRSRGYHWLAVVARLGPGVTHETAQAEASIIARHLAETYPDTQDGRDVRLQPLTDVGREELRRPLLGLWAAVGLVLFIACGNVAHLLLVRTMARGREFAIRSAVGASRGALVRQILTESLLLSVAGSVTGLLLGRWLVVFLAAHPGSGILLGQEIELNPEVFAYCTLAALLTVVLSGLAPALRASKPSLREVIEEGSQRGGSRRDRFREALVVAEIALALLVLVGASLLVKSFIKLSGVEIGVETGNLLTARISLPEERYPNMAPSTAGFYTDLLRGVSAIPGVHSAGVINRLPVQDWATNAPIVVEGRVPNPDGPQPRAEIRTVNPEYFQAMGIPILAGRTFRESDHGEDTPTRIIASETLVRTYWPDESAVGKRIAFGKRPESPEDWMTIVGVAGDVRSAGLDRETLAEIYIPVASLAFSEMTLAVRTHGEPTRVVDALRAEVGKIDPRQPIYWVKTMEQVVSDSLAQRRFTVTLFSGFAVLALLLAVAGVYGVMAFTVVRRAHEIGLRMALGACRRDVLWLVVEQGLVLATVGAVMGIGLALGLTRWLESQLYAVTSRDPAAFLVAVALLFAVTFWACFLPARNASKADPMAALYYE